MDVKGDVGIAQLKSWIDGHHREVDGVHVFAIAGPPPFGESDNRWDIDIEIPIGPVILQLVGYIDLSTLDVDIAAYVKIPGLPALKVGELKGNLNDGIEISFDLVIIKGSLRLYIKDKCLWLAYELTVFGTTWSGDIELICLPI
ncbi:hypothetical protein FRC02_000409, partial [Tulasnella sp. 418]